MPDRKKAADKGIESSRTRTSEEKPEIGDQKENLNLTELQGYVLASKSLN